MGNLRKITSLDLKVSVFRKISLFKGSSIARGDYEPIMTEETMKDNNVRAIKHACSYNLFDFEDEIATKIIDQIKSDCKVRRRM